MKNEVSASKYHHGPFRHRLHRRHGHGGSGATSSPTAAAAAAAAPGYVVISKEVEIMADRFRQHMFTKVHKHNMKRYENTFTGREAIDFMIESNMAATRDEAVELGMEFLQGVGTIQQVLGHHHSHHNNDKFKDDHRSLYTFTTSSTGSAMKSMTTDNVAGLQKKKMKVSRDVDDEEETALDIGIILARALLVVAALGLLWGRAAIAGLMSCLSILLLLDLPTNKKNRTSRFSTIDQYLVVSMLSVEASLGSWGILSWVTYVGTNNDVESIWVSCKVLQKLAGVLIVAMIVLDIHLKSKPPKQKQKSDPLTGQKRKDDLTMTEIRITLIEGRDLVPKDQNIFGKFTTSDPYVVIKYGNDDFGRSQTIRKTLNPVFTKSDVFTLHVHPGSLESKKLELHLYDFDFSSEDDAMGVVTIHLPACKDTNITSWYPVEKGKGIDYCEDASGELKVNVQVKHPANLEK